MNEVIKFLRQREIVHFQRFGEALNKLQSKLEHKKVYANGIKKDCIYNAAGGRVVLPDEIRLRMHMKLKVCHF